MDADKLARAWMEQMDEKAETLTKILGLPDEAKHDVLFAAYEADPLLFGALSKANSNDDTRLKDLVYQLTEGFLSTHMQEHIQSFQILWERLKTLPLEALSEGQGQRSVAFQGIGFTGGQRFQRLLSIISTISWAVVNYPPLSETDPEQIRGALVKEAQARGCPRVLSNALARYLQTQAPYKHR